MSMAKPDPANLRSNRDGTTAVEFAIIAPAFITLIVGSIYLCLGLFLVGSLHFAVEEGARCASVNTTVCSDSSAIISYAQSRYFGPASSPKFSYAAAACGNSVSASVDYVANLGFKSVTIPITAAACFP
jgi:Flp pilus assembly protein TadG